MVSAKHSKSGIVAHAFTALSCAWCARTCWGIMLREIFRKNLALATRKLLPDMFGSGVLLV